MPDSTPGLARPGEHIVGTSSPVVQCLALLADFFESEPVPDIATSEATACGLLSANHLLQLIDACGLLNLSGRHSAAVVLLRSLEDALDCFAAVTLVSGAAEDWAARDLKPSEAAKRWTALFGDEVVQQDFTLADYRKASRGTFNQYSHCSYDLCLWDLYLKPTPHPDTAEPGVVPEINRTGLVIESNAHAVDAHVTAHLLEFVDIVKRAYSSALAQEPGRSGTLEALEVGIIGIMEGHDSHGCQDVRTPPEIRGAESE